MSKKNEVKCPKCGHKFVPKDESVDISRQIQSEAEEIAKKEIAKIENQRLKEKKEYEEKLEKIKKENKQDLKNSLNEQRKEYEEKIDEINEKLQQKSADNDKEINKQLKIKLKEEQERLKKENKSNLELEKKRLEMEYEKKNNKITQDNKDMKSKISELSSKNKALTESIKTVKTEAENIHITKEKDLEKKITELNGKLDQEKINHEATLKQTQSNHELEMEKQKNELKSALDTIKSYENRSANLGTKLLGEDLEQYCLTEFNKYRANSFTKNVYFNKDNKSVSEVGGKSTKGDFVFRDTTDDGKEILSVMFEMKNQNTLEKTKKKNAEFIDKLDTDRTKKGCEYAILVSNLEPDNDFYNGIIDAAQLDSKYIDKKIYIIRPSNFIGFLLQLYTLNKEKLELTEKYEVATKQNVDIGLMEEELNRMKQNVATLVKGGLDNYAKAIKNIDDDIDFHKKGINKLEDAKKALLGSQSNFSQAKSLLEDVSIKKLSKKDEEL